MEAGSEEPLPVRAAVAQSADRTFALRGPWVLPLAVLVLAAVSGVVARLWSVALAVLATLVGGFALSLLLFVLATPLGGQAIMIGLCLALMGAVPLIAFVTYSPLRIRSASADFSDASLLSWENIERAALTAGVVLCASLLVGAWFFEPYTRVLSLTVAVAAACLVGTALAVQPFLSVVQRLDRRA